MVVGSGCLQRTTAAGVVWQLSVRRGTASEDGACSTFMVGRLGLQRTAAGCLVLLSDSGVVHRRKTAQATTWFASLVAVAVLWVAQRDAVVRRARFGCLMGILEHRATLFIILQRLKEWIHGTEYCGGCGGAPACGVFSVAT